METISSGLSKMNSYETSLGIIHNINIFFAPQLQRVGSGVKGCWLQNKNFHVDKQIDSHAQMATLTNP